MSIAALLQFLDIDPRMVAVEYDQLVIKRARYGETMIDEGGEVEIVNFVGGGSGRGPRCGRGDSRASSPWVAGRPRIK